MYGEGKRYTPYDVHNIIMTQYVEDNTGLVPKCWEQISTWCLLVQQTDDIYLDVSAITEPDREFIRWTAARIATTLGYKHGEVNRKAEHKTNSAIQTRGCIAITGDATDAGNTLTAVA